ncbi:hypothetical protein H5410_014516 [Solanum commersonii]|uniref:Uncharacterized protein n=1 Tax=Solanum commersonii TaxID=4109 RepID=A0A9J5ZRM5_SOLCO|nr:hypothetical protein H5410_014516 [Solanum commersonii]
MDSPMFALNTTAAGGSNCANVSAHMADNYLSQQDEYVNWIVDTGASNHMISDHTHLLAKGLIENAGQVQLPTRDSTRVSHVGNCSLRGVTVVPEVSLIPSAQGNEVKLVTTVTCGCIYTTMCTQIHDQ